MPKVLISDKMSEQAAQIFADNQIEVDIKTDLKEDELCAIIGNYDGLAVRSSTKVTAKVLEAGATGKLKVVGRAGIGVDNVDVPAATGAGVVVMNTPFGNAITTAEHAISLMMALARQIPAANASTHAGKWEKSRFMGVELFGKTLGLIGAGNIGSIVASRAQGLKMRVVAFDPFLTEERATELEIEKVDLASLLAQADFITIHTPLTAETKGLLNKDTLAKCKRGVRIINCARGGIIVEQDLLEALTIGHVAGAALDVFEVEPAKANPLFGRDDVICTPHLGASTVEAQEKVALQLAEQMSHYLNHGAINNALNMPSISAAEAPKLKPFIELASKIGSLIGQLNRHEIHRVSITYSGHAREINTKPLTQVILANLLSHTVSGVNMVNAGAVANQRGIVVVESQSTAYEDFPCALKVAVDTPRGERWVTGTLFGDHLPRVIDIKGIRMETELKGHMLYVANEDKPGLVGQVGTLLGTHRVNIGTFYLGRQDRGGKALALLAIDSAPSQDLLNQLQSIPLVTEAVGLYFEG